MEFRGSHSIRFVLSSQAPIDGPLKRVLSLALVVGFNRGDFSPTEQDLPDGPV
jgi:hypothetical protein